MYKRKLSKELHCPLEYGLDIFRGKWKTRILCVISETEFLRYGELKTRVEGISDTILSENLKELLDAGIVEKTIIEDVSPYAEYSLTGKGRNAVPILQSICRWSQEFGTKDSKSKEYLCSTCKYR